MRWAAEAGDRRCSLLGLSVICIAALALALITLELPQVVWRDAKRLNHRLHEWLVESGTLACEKCGSPRELDLGRLLRGPSRAREKSCRSGT